MAEDASFITRDHCVACGSAALATVAEGRFTDEPLHGLLAADPWGESPLPHLTGAQWRLRACRSCGMRFHGEILDARWRAICLTRWMSGESIQAFEAAQGGDSQAACIAGASAWVGHVLSIEKMTRDRRDGRVRLLDFGCGSGDFLRHAAQFGFEAWGIDASTARRDLASQDGVAILPALDDLPSALKGSFDAVSLFEVLEHLDAPLETLRALRPWLRPGGLLVLEVPDAGHVAAIRTIEDYRAIHPLDHINAFAPRTLTQIAERAGFRRVRRKLAFVSDGPVQTLRREAKRLRDWLRPPTTRQYFRAV